MQSECRLQLLVHRPALVRSPSYKAPSPTVMCLLKKSCSGDQGIWRYEGHSSQTKGNSVKLAKLVHRAAEPHPSTLAQILLLRHWSPATGHNILPEVQEQSPQMKPCQNSSPHSLTSNANWVAEIIRLSQSFTRASSKFYIEIKNLYIPWVGVMYWIIK